MRITATKSNEDMRAYMQLSHDPEVRYLRKLKVCFVVPTSITISKTHINDIGLDLTRPVGQIVLRLFPTPQTQKLPDDHGSNVRTGFRYLVQIPDISQFATIYRNIVVHG